MEHLIQLVELNSYPIFSQFKPKFIKLGTNYYCVIHRLETWLTISFQPLSIDSLPSTDNHEFNHNVLGFALLEDSVGKTYIQKLLYL